MDVTVNFMDPPYAERDVFPVPFALCVGHLHGRYT